MMATATGTVTSKKLKRDFIAVVVLVAIILVAFVATQGASASEEKTSAVAVIHASDDSETTLPLDTPARVTIETDLGTNTVVVENGQVYVAEADCPNHDCMEQGHINSSSQQLVCLPHKLWVEIKSPDQGEYATQSQ